MQMCYDIKYEIASFFLACSQRKVAKMGLLASQFLFVGQSALDENLIFLLKSVHVLEFLKSDKRMDI
jgi:hypothetical protein